MPKATFGMKTRSQKLNRVKLETEKDTKAKKYRGKNCIGHCRWHTSLAMQNYSTAKMFTRNTKSVKIFTFKTFLLIVKEKHDSRFTSGFLPFSCPSRKQMCRWGYSKRCNQLDGERNTTRQA